MDFWTDVSASIDLRDELHNVLHGDESLPGQGQTVILRRVTDTQCPGCWDAKSGGSNRPNCSYCKGEGYQFTETVETMGIFRGVAPVYKTGVLADGQFPQAAMGYTDANRATGYAEVCRDDGSQVYPDYERYTLQTHKSYDKLYEVKVDPDGSPIVDSNGNYTRAAKWKVLTLVPVIGDRGRVEYFVLDMEKENV